MHRLRQLAATCTLFLYLLVPALVPACSGDAASSGPAGRWNLDASNFAGKMADALIEMGNAEAAARPMLVGKLESSRFVLDIHDDGTFDATQTILGQRRAYKGTWDLTGGTLTLDQTHEDGKEVKDRLAGPFSSGELTLIEEEQGVQVELKMLRGGAAVPPK